MTKWNTWHISGNLRLRRSLIVYWNCGSPELFLTIWLLFISVVVVSMIMNDTFLVSLMLRMLILMLRQTGFCFVILSSEKRKSSHWWTLGHHWSYNFIRILVAFLWWQLWLVCSDKWYLHSSIVHFRIPWRQDGHTSCNRCSISWAWWVVLKSLLFCFSRSLNNMLHSATCYSVCHSNMNLCSTSSTNWRHYLLVCTQEKFVP